MLTFFILKDLLGQNNASAYDLVSMFLTSENNEKCGKRNKRIIKIGLKVKLYDIHAGILGK